MSFYSFTPEVKIELGKMSSVGNHDSYLFLTELAQRPPFQTKLLHEVHSPFLSGKKEKGKKHSCIRNDHRLTKFCHFIYPYMFSVISALLERKIV